MPAFKDTDDEMGVFVTYVDFGDPKTAEITVFFRMPDGKKRMDIEMTRSSLETEAPGYWKETLYRLIKSKFKNGEYVNATESVHD